jgi:predicted RND superfamily exporter protein
VIALPVAVALGALGIVAALQVGSGFAVTDFLSSGTDFAQSIDRASEHFPSAADGQAMIYIEGDLTEPGTLAAIDAAVAQIDASGADFGRNGGGELGVSMTAADAARLVMATPAAAEAVGASTGIPLSDDDGNGLPDTAAQVQAVYDHIATNGIVDGDGTVLVAPADVPLVVAALDGGRHATAIRVTVSSFADAGIIQPAWDVLEEAADELSATAGLTTVGATGEVITQFNSIESFSRSMQISLPIAMALAFLIAALILRSVRYAVAAVVPIAFVVIGVYAFMYLVGYQLNVITAMFAAIAVGVGIDFSTHFTARFREELAAGDGSLESLRRAGAGTGGALVLSALTSVLGFTVMALAPMPLFSTFGVLTAMMIALALAASLLVLPSVLAFITPAPRVARSVAPVEGDAEPALATAG